MKIYLLLLDALPWGSDLAALAEKHGLKPIRTINNGTFTHTSMLSRLTGRLPCDLVRGGIGLRTAELPRFGGANEQSLFRRLAERGWRVQVHNSMVDSWLSFLATEPPPLDLTEDHWDGRAAWLESRWPGLSITSAKADRSDFGAWDDPSARARFYSDELAHTRAVQASVGPPLFFLATLSHWHQVHYYLHEEDPDAARAAMTQWLEGWDFNEPDALFWVFCDHGANCTVEAPPEDFVSWTLVRDNTGGTRSWSPIIAGCDFYSLACELANLADDSGARSPHAPPDPERIYFIEDARKAVASFESVTAAACTVTAWTDDGEPESLTQLSWMRHVGRYAAFRAPVTAPERYEPIAVNFGDPVLRRLRDALFDRIGWMRDDPHPRLPLGPRLRGVALNRRERRDERSARRG